MLSNLGGYLSLAYRLGFDSHNWLTSSHRKNGTAQNILMCVHSNQRSMMPLVVDFQMTANTDMMSCGV